MTVIFKFLLFVFLIVKLVAVGNPIGTTVTREEADFDMLGPLEMWNANMLLYFDTRDLDTGISIDFVREAHMKDFDLFYYAVSTQNGVRMKRRGEIRKCTRGDFATVNSAIFYDRQVE